MHPGAEVSLVKKLNNLDVAQLIERFLEREVSIRKNGTILWRLRSPTGKSTFTGSAAISWILLSIAQEIRTGGQLPNLGR